MDNWIQSEPDMSTDYSERAAYYLEYKKMEELGIGSFMQKFVNHIKSQYKSYVGTEEL